jgi:hypothetical protein
MEKQSLVGREVVTHDDHKLGHVVDIRDDCVIVETGHVFKSRHAIPASFLHEHDGLLRATVSKDVFTDSPKVEDEHWSSEAVLAHYGLSGIFEVDPEPDSLENAETVGVRQGVDAPPEEWIRTLGDDSGAGYDRPAVRERQASAADPTGNTANLSTRKPR